MYAFSLWSARFARWPKKEPQGLQGPNSQNCSFVSAFCHWSPGSCVYTSNIRISWNIPLRTYISWDVLLNKGHGLVFTKTCCAKNVPRRMFQLIVKLDIWLMKLVSQCQKALTKEKFWEFGPWARIHKINLRWKCSWKKIPANADAGHIIREADRPMAKSTHEREILWILPLVLPKRHDLFTESALNRVARGFE